MDELIRDTVSLRIQDDDEWKTRYKNTHRYAGYAVIICNIKFEKDHLGERRDAELDVNRMVSTLEQKGFFVEKPHYNKTSHEMLEVLDKAAKAKDVLCDSDCFLCVLSSHGSWDVPANKQIVDMIYGTDNLPQPVLAFTSRVSSKYCPYLDGKPKIFLMQFCRGDRYPISVEVTSKDEKVVDAKTTGSLYRGNQQQYEPEDCGLPYHIPIMKDYLLHYATVPGYVSYKKARKGTPFLQAWCDILEQPDLDEDILGMATKVNNIVALEFESNAPSKAKVGLHKRKQMPQSVSMLTRDFFLSNKTNNNQ